MNYCDANDIVERLQWSIRKHELFGMGSQIRFIGLMGETKRSHQIQGWMAITGEDTIGDTHPLLDIWVGFDFKYFEEINSHLKQATQYLLLEPKMYGF